VIRPLRGLPLTVGLAIASLVVGPVAAALTPLPVVDLFTDDLVLGVNVVAGPEGDVVVGWTGQNNLPATVLAAFRPAGGSFAPVEFLTTVGNGESPRFVFEPGGNVLAVWSHATTAQPGAFSTRTRAGTFTAAQPLPTGDRFADVDIDAAGNALAAWKSSASTGGNAVVAARRAVGGTFGTPEPLSATGTDNFVMPQVVVNAAGEAVVGWARRLAADASVVEARIGTVAGPTFGPLDTLAAENTVAEGLSAPSLGIAPNGEAVAVWTRFDGTGTRIEFAVRAPGSAGFAPVQTLALDASGPRIAFDAAGGAVIAFVRGPEGAQIPSAIARAPDGVLGPIVPLRPAVERAGVTSVGVDGSGATLVAWTVFPGAGGGSAVAEAARRPAAGAFGPVAQIADLGAGRGLSVAVEPNGDAVAAWSVALSATEVVVRLGGLRLTPDPPPPTLAPVAVAAIAVRCQGRPATIVGTPGPDALVGTAGPDVIASLGGADIVRGGGGADVVCAGPGGDRVLGGQGRDLLVGGPGGDRLSGAAGPDRLLGGAGIDVLRGGAGPDRLLGGAGADILRGGPGRDTLIGGPGLDALRQREA
jgi:hypothetical protein